MAIPSVDLTTLNNLSPNLDIGDIADPALRLQAFQYLYNKLTEAVADLNAFQVGGAIKTVNLADGNVVTVKLADNAVTGPKILDGAIITAKLADGSVSDIKIKAPINENKLGLDYNTAPLSQRLLLLEQAAKDGEVLAARGGYPSLADRLNALDPGFGLKTESFIATEGQTAFNLTTGSYLVGSRRIWLSVGGVPKFPGIHFTETSPTSFTLLQGVTVGTEVAAMWFEGNVSLISGHGQAHRKGGSDEINITTLAGYQENVGTVLAQTATKTELTNGLAPKAEKTYTDQQLLLKRDIATKIPSADLDSSADSTRIKLANLADEVRQAMTGTTPVNATPAARGVTSDKIALDAVIGEHLALNYDYKGTIDPAVPANPTIKTATKQGTYLVVSSAADLPAGFTGGALKVEVFNSRWIFQHLIALSDTGISYMRMWDNNTPPVTVDWRKVYDSKELVTDAITQTHLSSQYDYRGTLATEDLNTIVKSGLYTITTSTIPNKPPLATSGGILTVRAIGDFIVQEFVESADYKNVYRRVLRVIAGTASSWEKVLVGAASVANFTDNYASRPTINSGVSLNTATKEGTYLVISGALDVPTTGSGTLIVNNINNRWIVQNFIKLNDSSVRWIRTIDLSNAVPQVPIYYAWRDLTYTLGSHMNGKKIVCFGDSITEGGTYPTIIAQRTGATVYNVGFGGCRLTYHTSADYDKMSMTKLADYIVSRDFTDLDAATANLKAAGDDNTAIVTRLKGIDFTTVDYITIFYGTNDFYSGVIPIGIDADKNATTFKGAVNYVLDKILTAYPQIKILFITPMWRARQDTADGKESDTNPNASGLYLVDYVDAILKVSGLNKVPSLDMYRKSGINKYNQAYYLSDGLHGTTAGYDLIGNKIASYLLSSY